MAENTANKSAQSFAGRVAIITGASTGLGEVMARVMAAEGAKIVGLARTKSTLEAVAVEVNAAAGEMVFLAIAADVSDRHACDDAVARTIDAFGTVDILINNAGVGANHARPKGITGVLKFWDCDPDLWDEAVAINSSSGFYMARLAVRPMMEKGWGRIINNTTNFHTMLGPGRACYGPGKAGLEASTAIWSKELEGTGVTVNVIFPGGPTDTPIHAHSRGIPIDKMLKSNIIAEPILWLASSASDGITGQRLNAKLWDKSLSPGDAAKRALVPAGWDALAVAVAQVPHYYD
jgi:NAD(P)-dependent dehydrogenase (short-subunit alcohol dehydrogenase family)